MAESIARLGAAVEVMHHETVACRRNLMVFRARMDATEGKVAIVHATLQQTMDVLDQAGAGARRASAIFRATAEGHSAA